MFTCLSSISASTISADVGLGLACGGVKAFGANDAPVPIFFGGGAGPEEEDSSLPIRPKFGTLAASPSSSSSDSSLASPSSASLSKSMVISSSSTASAAMMSLPPILLFIYLSVPSSGDGPTSEPAILFGNGSPLLTIPPVACSSVGVLRSGCGGGIIALLDFKPPNATTFIGPGVFTTPLLIDAKDFGGPPILLSGDGPSSEPAIFFGNGNGSPLLTMPPVACSSDGVLRSG
mmetsp:Transcript_12055/g.26289  ORF Transcript_12055/g.26289 Transcript_12055/m.26289 type:complete len:233 (+) Transcript_12055:2860-3558(+)